MAKSLTSAPATASAYGVKALKSAYFCYFLAALVMLVTGWVIVQGIEATEPASPARNAKVASGLLLLVLEGCAFSLAGQWREFSFVLRTLGWSIFGLQIALMTLANYSVGATAGKAAALSTATVAQIVAQADDSRKNAATLREAAAKLNKSKHGWLNEQGGKVSAEAAQQTAAGAGAVEKLEKMQALNVSTPLVETIGTTGLMVLSGVLSIIMECAGIALMHVAGSLRNKAAAGTLPVEQQILELLHRVHGAPAGTVAPVAPVQAAPVAPSAPAQAAAAAPAEPVAPAPAPAPEKPSFGFIPNMARMSRAEVDTLQRVGHATSKRVNDDMSAHANDDTPAPAKTDAVTRADGTVLTSLERVNDDTPAHVNDDVPEEPAKARKERVARDSAVMDSGTGPLDGFRYRRAMAGVKAGKIRPTILGLYDGVGVSAPTAKRFLEAMEKAGVIVRAGRGYALASKGAA